MWGSRRVVAPSGFTSPSSDRGGWTALPPAESQFASMPLQGPSGAERGLQGQEALKEQEAAGEREELLREESAGPGLMELTLLRFPLAFLGTFSAMATVCMHVAAAPQYILLYTRLMSPSPGVKLRASFYAFVLFPWVVCLRGLCSQILWRWVWEWLRADRPLLRERCRFCRRFLGSQQVWVGDLVLVGLQVYLWIAHRVWYSGVYHITETTADTICGGGYWFCTTLALLQVAASTKDVVEALLKPSPEGLSEEAKQGLRLIGLSTALQLAHMILMFFCPNNQSPLIFIGLVTTAMLIWGFHNTFHRLMTEELKSVFGTWFLWISGVALLLMFMSFAVEVAAGMPVLRAPELEMLCGEGSGCYDSIFSVFAGGRAWDERFEAPGDRAGVGAYPVCRVQVGDPGAPDAEQLTPLDLGVFARAVYEEKSLEVEVSAKKAFKGTDLENLELLHVEDGNTVARIGVFRLPDAQVDVIAVRGSTILRDWIYNAYIWGPGALWNLFMRILLPGGCMIPGTVAPIFLSGDLLLGDGLSPAIPFFDAVERAVKRARDLGHTPILTGHSLGGGMAQAAGAKFSVPVVTFSPVGMSFTKGRLGLSSWGGTPPHAVESNVVSVVPEGDPVPLLEPQLGMVQYIPCATSLLVNPVKCHSLTRTICELYRKCGDPRGRRPTYCAEELGPDWDAVPSHSDG